MSAQRWKQIEELFHAAVAVAPHEREAFLADSCDDPALLEEVRELLKCEIQPLEFLDRPACQMSALALDEYKPDIFPAQRIGPYRIERQIGLGGMGVVYLGVDAGGRRVAIKLIRRGLIQDEHRPGTAGREALRRFVTEQRALSALDHPFVARLIDAGATEDGRPYLVMEYVAGEPIDRYCDANSLAISQRLHLFRKVCAAVEYAHQNLIVHRDLKPANILVTPEGIPKLLDFGIAKLLGTAAHTTEPATQTVLRAMTPKYASPEQIRGEMVSTATDVYALGVILYELLCGHSPHSPETATRYQVERAICELAPERPSTVLQRVMITTGSGATEILQTPAAVARTRQATPEKLRRLLVGDLDTIVLTALRKEPPRRYLSVERLSDDLRRHLQGLPVSARADTFTYVATKFIRRNRAAVLATALVLIALLGGMLSTIWQARRAVQAQHDALRLARSEADQRQEKVQVIAFLQDLLGSVSPLEEGRNVTVLNLLNRASAGLASELSDRPLVQAAVRAIIGNTYRSLGSYDLARPHLQDALLVRRARLGPDHADVGRSLQDLSMLLRNTGEYAAAEPAQREAVAVLRAAYGDEHAEVARSVANLALLMSEKGDLPAAEALHRQALAGLHADQGPLDVAACLGNLANTLIARGNHFEAEQHLREALGIMRGIYGHNGHPHLALLINSLVTVLRSKGDFAASVALQREAVGMLRRHLGDRHDHVSTALNNLGGMLVGVGDFAGAEEAYRQAIAVGRSAWGSEHPKIAIRLTNLATVLLQQGAFADAEQTVRQAVGMKRELWGPDHIEVAYSLAVLAWVVQMRGTPGGAEKLYREALSIADRQFSRAHPLTASLLDGLGAVLSERGAIDAAEQSLEQAMNLRRELFGEAHAEVAKSLLTLGRHAAHAGDLLRAEHLVRESLAIRRGALPADSLETMASILALGEVMLAQGREAQAEPLLREAMATCRAAQPSSRWRAAEVGSALGACLTSLGRSREAREVLSSSSATLMQIKGPHHADTIRAGRRLEEAMIQAQR